jgi:hypothetical protein
VSLDRTPITEGTSIECSECGERDVACDRTARAGWVIKTILKCALPVPRLLEEIALSWLCPACRPKHDPDFARQ